MVVIGLGKNLLFKSVLGHCGKVWFCYKKVKKKKNIIESHDEKISVFPLFGRTTETKADELGLTLFYNAERYSLRYLYREVYFLKRLIHYGRQQLVIKRA